MSGFLPEGFRRSAGPAGSGGKRLIGRVPPEPLPQPIRGQRSAPGVRAREATTRRSFTCLPAAYEGFYSSSSPFCPQFNSISFKVPVHNRVLSRLFAGYTFGSVAVLCLIIPTPVYLLLPSSSCLPENVQPDPLESCYSRGIFTAWITELILCLLIRICLLSAETW